MRNIAIMFMIVGLVCAMAPVVADQIEDFEDEASNFKYPAYSGSTQGISDSAIEYTTERTNTRLDPSVGEPGSFSMKYTWTWDSLDQFGAANSSAPFVRCTTYPERIALPQRNALGFYYFLPSSTGNVDIGLTVVESPTDTGDNETYEGTEWFSLSPESYWQYLYIDFSTTAWDDPDNWVAIFIESLGDGVYDGDSEAADEPTIESLNFRCAASGTETDFIIYIDDLYDGDEQTPAELPTASYGWELYE